MAGSMPTTARGLQSEQWAPKEPPTAITNKKITTKGNLCFLPPPKNRRMCPLDTYGFLYPQTPPNKGDSQMKTAFNRVLTLFGIALLAAAMVFLFTACPEEPEPDPEIPSALENTTWTNTPGDKISFTKDSVKVKPIGKSESPYKLVDTIKIDSANQITLCFKDKQSTDDTIIYRNGTITTVNFAIILPIENRGKNWKPEGEGAGSDDGEKDSSGNYTYLDFKYTVNNSAVTITGYTGSGGNVAIPETINGKPVTAIRDGSSIYSGVFYNKQLTSVTIPNSVTSIGNYAFWENKLTSVTIGNSVTSIGYGAFQGNQRTSVTNGANVTLSDEAFGYIHNYEYKSIGFVAAYNGGGKLAGRYTRTSTDSTEWTRQ
jgi:hypothetical protein